VTRLRTLALGAALALTGCPRATPPFAEPAPTGAPTGGSRAEPASTKKPKTVVLFVLDQLASWVLLSHLPHLPPDGACQRGLREGAFVERVAYAYATTTTAQGHSAIVTGQPPWKSGVVANELLDADGKERSIVNDGKHPVHGREGAFASPSVLRVPTVGDALRAATGGRARQVAIAGKDRAAVLMGGRQPDIALWYDHATRGYTTSSYYDEALPEPIASWQSAHPVSALFVPWQARDAALYARVLGPDDAPGEGDYLGLGVAFPHDLANTQNPYATVRLAPQHTEHMLELAYFCAEQAGIGQDDVTDLLLVSVSGTDYAGHTFGPTSWEYLDHLIRADVAMAKLVARLEERGPVAVLITADHGVAGLPEQDPKIDLRLMPDELERAAEEAVATVLGEGKWVAGYTRPFLFLKPGIPPDKREAARAAVERAMPVIKGVHGAWNVNKARALRADPDPIKRAVGLSMSDDTPGDVYILIDEHTILDEDRPRGKGTTHGTPFPHDTQVPVIFWGPGVTPKRITELLEQDRVAPTLSALLRAPPPEGVTASPLPGAPAP
jgi:hypothetical protein